MNLYESFKENKDLYLFEFEDYKVLFRPLTWGDYRTFSSLLIKYPSLQTEIEEIIWEMCVLEHNCAVGIQYMDAGIVTSISQSIIFLSGCTFMDEDSLDQANQEFMTARESVNYIDNQIVLAICEAFPAYKPEDIKDLSWSDVLNRLALSETILKRSFEFKKKNEVTDNSHEVFKMLDKMGSDTSNEQLYREQVDEANNVHEEKDPRWNKRQNR